MKRVSMSVAIAAATLAFTAIASQAEPTSPLRTPDGAIAQSQQTPPRSNFSLDSLGLTADQQAKITEIRNNAQTQIEKVLTAEQKQQLSQAIPTNQGAPKTMPRLNLSAEQKQQIRQALQTAQDQISAVLTPEQRSLLRQ